MKRISALLAVLLLLLCSCSSDDGDRHRTADMLNITNTEQTLSGCIARFESVVSAMKAKVSVLEKEHNKTLEVENPTEYFLETNYILTAFEPFSIASLEVADGFNSDMTNETAQSFYELQSGNADIVYESDGKANFNLKFVSEELTEEYSAEYNKKADSFSFTVKTEDSEGEHIREFLEFSKTESGAYVIQSNTTRSYIEFNEDDEIVYFCCGELRNGSFSQEESIYSVPDETVNRNWVLSVGKARFMNIHMFEDGILTHEDCSSGPWKSIKIAAEDYESAFYKN